MSRDDAVSRRRTLRLVGVGAGSALLAGCGGPGGGVGPGEGRTDNVDDPEEDQQGDDQQGEGNGDEDQVDRDWADVDTIHLEVGEDGWRGREPNAIEGETNPTLVLFEGRTYEVVWENMDGDDHNFGVRAGDAEWLVSGETIREQGESGTVEFDATSGMSTYVCEIHPDASGGDVEVRSE